jgi:urease accessory protein
MTELPIARILSDHIHGPVAGTITLAYADRFLRRRRLMTDDGFAFLLDLPEPSDLADGMFLRLDDGRAVRMVAADEPLAAVTAEGASLARLAWHIGNRHTRCQICADRILIQRDHVLEEMLRGLGARIRHVEAPFQPEGGAYGHGRTHGHSHSHDPHEDPDAHLRAHQHGDEDG